MASDSESDSSSVSNPSQDSEHDDGDITVIENVAGEKRPHTGDKDIEQIPAKRSPNLLTSFFKSTGTNEKVLGNKAPEKKKRDYSKYKQVCLLCANSDKKKVREASILSRGAAYQVERHRKRNHNSLSTKEMTLKIVSIDHAAVPKNVRELALKAPVTKPNTHVDISNKEGQVSHQKELAVNKEQINKGTPVQRDMEAFVKITKQSFEEKMITMVERLNAKVDKLSHGSTTSFSTRPTSTISSKFSEEMRDAYGKMKEWRNVANIIELVNSVNDLQIYPLSDSDTDDFFNGTGAILRCETCFTLFKDKAARLTPAKAARICAADCKSICTGRYIEPEKMEMFMRGDGDEWRRLKSNVMQHMICAADGQTHFKALSAISEESNLKRKHYESAENLVKSALTAIKAKSAAMHYEDQVAFAFSVGAQVGQSGHCRKLVPDLVQSMLIAIQEKTKEALLRCLPSTGLPPHYYLAVDKATVNKRSNQGVIICPMIDGSRVPIVVAAPEVYKPTEGGSVEGGKAEDSATQALDQIEQKFGKTALDYLVGKYL